MNKTNMIKLSKNLGYLLSYIGIFTFFYDLFFNSYTISKTEIGILIIFMGIFSTFQSMEFKDEQYTFQHRLHHDKIKSLENKAELMEYSIQHLDDEITKIMEKR